jgi:predicted metal-dependent peptidase
VCYYQGMKRTKGFPYPVPDDYEDESYFTRERLQEAMGKMDRARGFLIAQEPWYGHFAIQMEWEPSTTLKVPTMGVTILHNGQIKCFWHPMFVLTRSIFRLASAIKHEIEHIVRLHPVRRDEREPQKWNRATDMAINGSKTEQNIAIVEDSESPKVLPFAEEEGVELIWRPAKFPAEAAAEDLYDLLEETPPQCGSCGGTGKQSKGDGEGNEWDDGGKGQDGDGDKPSGGGKQDGNASGSKGDCPDCGGTGQKGQVIDDHGSWEGSSATPEHARQIVQGVTEVATKNCGKAPGHLKKAIDALGQPIINWRHEFRTVFGRSVGKSRPTWSRMDRRRPVFGRPGKTRRGSGSALVICDTSGSVSEAEYRQFFGEIDGSICQNVRVSILLWDDKKAVADQEIKDIYWPLYRRGQWRKIERVGYGGTNMDEAVEYAATHRLLRGVDVVVVLTDGYTPWFQGSLGIPIINVITGAEGSVESPPPASQTNLYMNMGRKAA